MKITLLDLKFNAEHFYIQQNSIVQKIIFNNRIFYSKFEKNRESLNTILLTQHLNHEITLAIPLIDENRVNYIVIEYQQDDWKAFYALVKHLLKSLSIQHFMAYYSNEKELFQLFIPRDNLALELAYKEVENIKHLLEVKSSKSYKIYPNINLPKNLNIITLPTQKA